MFVAREHELEAMERLYERAGFQMLVIYGRRRVGKTALIGRFCEGKRALTFMAQMRSDLGNLTEFSQRVYRFFDEPTSLPAFASWSDAFAHLAQKAGDERIVVAFDEFPLAAQANPSLPSLLQIAIDELFKNTNVYLILCGSNQGFMENEVLAYKSPLYGRRTGQLKLAPFDYLDAARMLPDVCAHDALLYYACMGGTPYYLSFVDQTASFEQNMRELFFDKTGLLYEEPDLLLRQELREPALYSSILRSVAAGTTKPVQIAEKAGVERASVMKYLRTLLDLHILRKRVPFGENPSTSRKGMYELEDPCFAFWYRMVAAHMADIEADRGGLVAAQALRDERLSTYVGKRFESVCAQWLSRQALAGALPIDALAVGSWWGTDPQRRCQTDIDVLAADEYTHSALIGECKWREGFDETQAVEGLRDKARLLRGWEVTDVYLFTKNEVSAATRAKYADDDTVHFVTMAQLYAGLGTEASGTGSGAA